MYENFWKMDFATSQKSFQVNLSLSKLELNQGKYYVTSFLDDESGQIIDWVTDAFVINVLQSDFYGTGMVPPTSQSIILMDHSFSF